MKTEEILESLLLCFMGVQLSWESACFASKMSWVRAPLLPPTYLKPEGKLDIEPFKRFSLILDVNIKIVKSLFLWRSSSAGWSRKLIPSRSAVQVRPPLPWGSRPTGRTPVSKTDYQSSSLCSPAKCEIQSKVGPLPSKQMTTVRVRYFAPIEGKEHFK